MQSSIIKEIEQTDSSADFSTDDRARLVQMYRQLDFAEVCGSTSLDFHRLRIALEQGGVCRTFQFLHFDFRKSILFQDESIIRL